MLRAVNDPGQCTASEISLPIAEVDVVEICVSAYTGRLRYAGPGGACSAYEFAGFVLPEVVASVYVADSGTEVIKQFALDGQFIREWGEPGTGDGQFDDLYRITVGPDGYVYATDGLNCRVQKFTYYGAFVDQWGSCGTDPGQFGLPGGIEVDSQNNVFVTDLFNYRVQKFDAGGGFLGEWGSPGTQDGQFFFALEVAVDADDNVFVTDPIFNARVQEFDNAGAFQGKWLVADGPAGIDIDTINDIAYVTTFSRYGREDRCFEWQRSDTLGSVWQR